MNAESKKHPMGRHSQERRRLPGTPVFDCSEVGQLLRRTQHDRDTEAYRAYLKQVMERDYWKPLTVVDKPRLLAVQALATELPHCASVVDAILPQLASNLLQDAPVLALSPLAIGGPPGVGKTYFAERLATVLGVPTRLTNCAGLSTGMKLTGLDRGYSGAYPGELAAYLCHSRGAVANPLWVLDEFEKAGRQGSGAEDFHAAFYGLLEKLTARRFQDRFLGFDIDASHVNWICIVNAFDTLPEPIRSRLTYVEVEPPDRASLGQLIDSIYESIAEGQGDDGKLAPSLEHEVKVRLSELANPREIRKALEHAVGRARLRWVLSEAEAEAAMIHVRLVDLPEQKNVNRRLPFGFVPAVKDSGEPRDHRTAGVI